jgi:hypothetical protein
MSRRGAGESVGASNESRGVSLGGGVGVCIATLS